MFVTMPHEYIAWSLQRSPMFLAGTAGNAHLKAVNNRSPSLELPCGQRLLLYLGKHLSKIK